jgi:hypothetical protein
MRAETVIAKNSIADAAGMGLLSDSDLAAFAGIEGPAEEARIAEIELFGRVTGALVLCDEALGVYWNDENDDAHGWQMNDTPRMVRELIAAELVRWHERHPGVEINEWTLERLGFESVF